MNYSAEPWVIRVGRARGMFFLPIIVFVILASIYFWAYSTAPEEPRWFSKIQIFGMLALYASTPAYLLAGLFSIWRGAAENTQALAGQLNDTGIKLVKEINRAPSWLWFSVLVGCVIGASGFTAIRQTGFTDLPPHYWCLVIGNTLVWATVGYLVALRVPTAVSLFRLGRNGVNISLHDNESLRPFANIAFKDMFFIIGALALMGLQAIDQEFRWNNYSQGLFIGLPMAAMMFALPVLGVHKAMKLVKQQAVATASQEIGRAANIPTQDLELLLSYRDRVTALNTWPLDLKAAYKIMFYLIIPPLAWVGAALVENWISDLL